MSVLAIVAIIAAIWILLSAGLTIVLCMASSRYNQGYSSEQPVYDNKLEEVGFREKGISTASAH